MIRRRQLALAAGLLLFSAPGARAAPGMKNEADKNTLIQIGVEVVEVDEQKTQKLGVEWLSNLLILEKSVPALFKVGTFTRHQLLADLQALLEEGAADLLANPKLVTRTGTTASFHAGGELPYAVSSSLGSTNIEFKPYGIDLKISPRVLSNDQIAMSVHAEVSGPDDQNAVTLSGNSVPGIRSREVNSELTLTPGSTLSMAGLIQTQKAWTRRGVPGLMSIPLLGHLFSRKTQINKRTSVVVFITPVLLNSDGSLMTSSANVPLTPLMPPGTTPQPARDELLDVLDSSSPGNLHG